MKTITTATRIFFLLLVLGITTGHAQSFQKGQTDINLGIGLGNIIVEPGSINVLPPVSASVEFGITNDISLGGYAAFTGASRTYQGWEDCGQGNGNGQYYVDTYRWSYFILGVRGAYHFGRFIKVDKLDVYAGLMLGNDFAHDSYSTTSICPDHHQGYVGPTYGGFVFSLYGGARYRFTNHFGVFGELGYGISYLNVGLNFKF
ncbi:MAG TPA: hypothetical protein VGO45_09905 [Bacteroidia bacterium]|jgi:hypothetical protein|nr:hypothetical protein [Bacteroidia bacterium]